MSQQAILREYLVALGFRVNKSERKQVDDVVKDLDKRVLALGKAAVATTTAVTGMVLVMARQMEKLWYSARYADSTAEKLQEMEFGARNVGIEAGKMTASMKTFAASIRSNPGLQGLLNSLGIPVQGRDKADVMLDFVKALKGMPFYIAERYAAMFGMDPETLFNMQEGLETMKAAAEQRKQMAQEMGVDTDAAAEAGKRLSTQWRTLTERAGLFGQAVLIAAEGPMTDLMKVTEEVLQDWLKIINAIQQYGTDDFWKKIREGLGMEEPGGTRATLTKEQQERLGDEDLPYKAPEGNVGLGKWLEKYFRWRKKRGTAPDKTDAAAIEAATSPDGANINPNMSEAERVRLTRKRLDHPDALPTPVPALASAPAGPSGDAGERTGGTDAKALFAGLEAKYGLPAGLLDRLWNQESTRGRNMVSPKGAEGHFQFMPKTQDEYGLDDPYDLKQSADAAARKMRNLLKYYKGDLTKASAAYNWGEGNLDNYGLGNMPKETREFVKNVAGEGQGVNFTQKVDINVYGNPDPNATAQAVAKEQRQVGADTIRNFKPKVR